MRHAKSRLCVALIMALAVAPRATACTCYERPIWQRVADYDQVFAGVVIDVQGPDVDGEWVVGDAPVTYTFRIMGTWKGAVDDTLSVTSAWSGAACGYRFERGRQYLVFAHWDHGLLATSLCSGNALIDEARDDFRLLDPPLHVAPGYAFPASDPAGYARELADRLRESAPDLDWSLTRSIMDLEKHGDLFLESLGIILHEGNIPARERAAKLLGAWGYAARPAVPDLAEALGDTSLSVRWAAAYALANLLPELSNETVEAMFEVAKGERTLRSTLVAIAQIDPMSPPPPEVSARGGFRGPLHIMKPAQARRAGRD